MYRLGPWHTWCTLARPYGLHFFLDFTDPEQKDVGKDIVKLASKESMKQKAAAKQAGMTQAVQQLLGLHGNGLTISIPEDEKMWSMIESSYLSLEFTYNPTPDQVCGSKRRYGGWASRGLQGVKGRGIVLVFLSRGELRYFLHYCW